MSLNKESINSTRKTANSICAIQTAVPAMPPNPSMAAIMAIIKNVNDHDSIDITHAPSLLKKQNHFEIYKILSLLLVPKRNN